MMKSVFMVRSSFASSHGSSGGADNKGAGKQQDAPPQSRRRAALADLDQLVHCRRPSSKRSGSRGASLFGAATKVIGSLLTKGLIREVRAKLNHPVWRETDDDKRLTLVAN
jgi:hypothetical protein